ncbi:MAG: SDR family NAD-dependent epimerase/dehydratase, partial [Woeseiaceae bacterium]|nr:SDR family NAD-dependent epimerase/dehydratase [Woeseiaceae bacterium]
TTTPSDDNRSYHISSEKIKNELGFVAKHTIRDAVEGLCEAFDKKLLPNSLDDEIYFNIKRMQNINLS